MPVTRIQTWADEARREKAPLPVLMRRLLDEQPARWAEVAACLGLIPLEDAQLAEGHWCFEGLTLAEALARRVLPLEIDGERMVALPDPFDLAARQWLVARAGGATVRLAMAAPGAVDAVLAHAQRRQSAFDQFDIRGHEGGDGEAIEEISLASLARDTSPVIRLVNSTLFDALAARASDIHVESLPDGLAVRYRIDGVMQPISSLPGVELAEHALSRLKVLSGLDIGERRIPQDGRFKVRVQGREVDVRVSIMPSVHGEGAVLRILDKSQVAERLTLEALGIEGDAADRIRRLVNLPYGMVLVTGPTGSGKTTTLYAALTELNHGEEKLITIEDPVEYQLAGVLQIPVNDKKGLTFARGLRSILRHDPDTILVGEIRDGETAAIAVQAALTGHRVLSSVHANGVFGMIERFLFMDVEPTSLAEALNGVVAQRLARRVCPECVCEVAPDIEIIRRLGIDTSTLAEAKIVAGRGCEACRGTGYRGRLALTEALRLTPALKDALMRRASSTELTRLASDDGHRSMRDVAVAAALAGHTTLEEVRRVVSVD
ncbi:type II/IV secretion system protein [Crenobacter cavernae]|uniref:Type II/IV secretion system protein n=2 Tax=Crenobacter cavernae TaxID=2290923 RepID=A0ABY0FB90_9NEIS|nr:type II/IV secretion system protein [Crenobacter cavernae]